MRAVPRFNMKPWSAPDALIREVQVTQDHLITTGFVRAWTSPSRSSK